MRNNRIWIVTTVILLLVNLVMAYFIWSHKRPQHGDRDHRGGDRGDWIVKELNFDDRQKAEHKKLKDEHFATLKPIMDSIGAERKNLYNLIKDSVENDSLVNYYTQKIGQQHAVVSKLTFEHFKKVRALCTPAQQVKLDTLMQRIVTDMKRNK